MCVCMVACVCLFVCVFVSMCMFMCMLALWMLIKKHISALVYVAITFVMLFESATV